MELTFLGYHVLDDGILLTFESASASGIQVMLTDAELAGVSTQPQLRTLVTTKLQRKLRAAGIASKLDQFRGQTITI